MFYPAAASELRQQVDQLLGSAARKPGPPVKALIAPHAGYVYSGPVAASAYAQIAEHAERIRRVVLLGPVHRVPMHGLALPGARRFATPLGEVDVDDSTLATLRDLPQVMESPLAHATEHSLEVHLPFLQRLLGKFTLVPLAVGDASAVEVAEVIERLWGGDETLIIVSSDLSHYLPYDSARRIDRATVDRLLVLDERLDHEQACGATPIKGLLLAARRRGLRAELLDLRNSGDTAGDRRQVVGYAALAFRSALDKAAVEGTAADEDDAAKGPVLLAHARAALASALELAAPAAPERPFLLKPGASFVTLRQLGELRGCVGTLQAHRPLGVDVRANAIAAAFDDLRFAPLQPAEYEGIDIEVSLLSPSSPLRAASEAELYSQLRAGVDGLTLQLGARRSTFLPQVWQALPDAPAFVAELKRKAGLASEFWSPELRFSRYTVEKFTESEAWTTQ
jgi:AmmeMemoRadiSam system protein B/AmmeMemoRadiSam system protein A